MVFAEVLEAIGVTITKGENWIEAAVPKGLPLKPLIGILLIVAMTLAIVALFL